MIVFLFTVFFLNKFSGLKGNTGNALHSPQSTTTEHHRRTLAWVQAGADFEKPLHNKTNVKANVKANADAERKRA